MKRKLSNFWYVLCNFKTFLKLTFDIKVKFYKVPAEVLREFKTNKKLSTDNIPLLRKMYTNPQRMIHFINYPNPKWPSNWGEGYRGRNVATIPSTETSQDSL